MARMQDLDLYCCQLDQQAFQLIVWHFLRNLPQMKLRKGVLWSLLWKHPFWLQPFTATLEDGLQLKTQFSKLLAICT